MASEFTPHANAVILHTFKEMGDAMQRSAASIKAMNETLSLLNNEMARLERLTKPYIIEEEPY